MRRDRVAAGPAARAQRRADVEALAAAVPRARGGRGAAAWRARARASGRAARAARRRRARRVALREALLALRGRERHVALLVARLPGAAPASSTATRHRRARRVGALPLGAPGSCGARVAAEGRGVGKTLEDEPEDAVEVGSCVAGRQEHGASREVQAGRVAGGASSSARAKRTEWSGVVGARPRAAHARSASRRPRPGELSAAADEPPNPRPARAPGPRGTSGRRRASGRPPRRRALDAEQLSAATQSIASAMPGGFCTSAARSDRAAVATSSASCSAGSGTRRSTIATSRSASG